MASHLIVAAAMLLMIVAFLGLKACLELDNIHLIVKAATIFGVLACAIMVLQNTVQGTVMVRTGYYFLNITVETQRAIILQSYRGLRLIDQGIDIAFDMFFFSAWILFAIAMWRNAGFGKIFSITGVSLSGVNKSFSL